MIKPINIDTSVFAPLNIKQFVHQDKNEQYLKRYIKYSNYVNVVRQNIIFWTKKKLYNKERTKIIQSQNNIQQLYYALTQYIYTMLFGMVLTKCKNKRKSKNKHSIVYEDIVILWMQVLCCCISNVEMSIAKKIVDVDCNFNVIKTKFNINIKKPDELIKWEFTAIITSFCEMLNVNVFDEKAIAKKIRNINWNNYEDVLMNNGWKIDKKIYKEYKESKNYNLFAITMKNKNNQLKLKKHECNTLPMPNTMLQLLCKNHNNNNTVNNDKNKSGNPTNCNCDHLTYFGDNKKKLLETRELIYKQICKITTKIHS